MVYNSPVFFWHYAKKSAVKPFTVSEYIKTEDYRDNEINDKETDTLGISNNTYAADCRKQGGKKVPLGLLSL